VRLKRKFYRRDVLEVAPDLLGKYLCIRVNPPSHKASEGLRTFVLRKIITETEAYGGKEDLASHARFGRTERNRLMYGKAGIVYVYLIYGVYWMLNIITGKVDEPQGVLVRGLEGLNGPGKVGKWLELDKSFYGEDLTKSKRIWVEEGPKTNIDILKTKRVGVSYAGIWAKKRWRFTLS